MMIKKKIHTGVLFGNLDAMHNELLNIIRDEDEKKLNKIPFKNCWTCLQVLIHLTKSNNAITQGLQMKGKPAERDPEQNVESIKRMFLDFSVQYKSPAFILPEKGHHDKKETAYLFTSSIESLKSNSRKINLLEIIELPAFGAVTKMELLHFVLYHTTRHVRQLKNIIIAVNQTNNVVRRLKVPGRYNT